jgi:site-specific DNA-cytosine methylase
LGIPIGSVAPITATLDPICGPRLFAAADACRQSFLCAGDAIDLSFPTSNTRRGRVGPKAKNLMTSESIKVFTGARVRKLTLIECERLQGLPDRYTETGINMRPFHKTGRGITQNYDIVKVSDAQRYKAIGNAFNVDVVAHILSFI